MQWSTGQLYFHRSQLLGTSNLFLWPMSHLSYIVNVLSSLITSWIHLFLSSFSKHFGCVYRFMYDGTVAHKARLNSLFASAKNRLNMTFGVLSSYFVEWSTTLLCLPLTRGQGHHLQGHHLLCLSFSWLFTQKSVVAARCRLYLSLVHGNEIFTKITHFFYPFCGCWYFCQPDSSSAA